MNEQRLLALADHLEHPERWGHKVFDFSDFNNSFKPECGTAGCAIGEMPILDPENWVFDEIGMPDAPNYSNPRDFIYSESTRVIICTINYFELPEDLPDWSGYDCFIHLFSPDSQRPSIFGGSWLYEDATAQEVADNIRAFVAHKKAEVSA